MFDFGIWLPRCFGYETEEKEKEESEGERKWMALFRDLIFLFFFTKFLETFLFFLANLMEFMLLTRFKFKYERSSSLMVLSSDPWMIHITKGEIFREILNRIFRGLKVKILKNVVNDKLKSCLLYTSDAADE